MTIYVVLGKSRNEPEFVEVLVAKTFVKDAEEFCIKQLEKKDNPYSDVSWKKTELETK